MGLLRSGRFVSGDHLQTIPVLWIRGEVFSQHGLGRAFGSGLREVGPDREIVGACDHVHIVVQERADDRACCRRKALPAGVAHLAARRCAELNHRKVMGERQRVEGPCAR